jgi:hypothetical protein
MAFDTEENLLAAANSREAEEGDHLELKRELPAGEAGAREIGKDLAAMALGGGVILVGVDEGPPATLTPITLAGQRERVENIARGVDPPVTCQVALIRKEPPVTGYLVHGPDQRRCSARTPRAILRAIREHLRPVEAPGGPAAISGTLQPDDGPRDHHPGGPPPAD